MKTFDKQINKIKRTRLLTAIILFLLALVTLIYGIIEIIPKEIQYEEFDKNNQNSSYVKTKIKYLTGPIIEATNTKTEEIFKYYMAFGTNDEFFIVKTGEETELPIYGIDVTEENIDTLEETEIYGIAQMTSSSLFTAIKDVLNSILEEEIVDNINVIGYYYFDTAAETISIAKNLFILTAILAVLGVLYLYVNLKIRKKVNMNLEDLKAKGKLEDVIKEYDSEKIIEYKKVKVDLSPKYLYSYNNGMEIIEINDIKEASFSQRQLGSRDKNKYIILLTKDNREYYISPFQKKAQKVVANELLEKIKSMIK